MRRLASIIIALLLLAGPAAAQRVTGGSIGTSPLSVGGVLATPAAGLAKALTTTQIPSGAVPAQDTFLNVFTIGSDAAVGNNYRLYGAGVNWTCCTSTATGERMALTGNLVVNSASNATDPVPSYVGVFGRTLIQTAAPNANAGTWAGNFNATMDSTATGWAQISAAELDVTVLSGANPLTKIGLPIVLGGTDAVQGSVRDAAISFYAAAGSAVGWKNILLIDQQAPHGTTIATTGCIVCTVGTMSFTTGLDLSGATISGNFLKGPNDFVVGGDGYLKLKRNQSIQFSSAGVTRNLARFLSASDTITFGDADNSGSAPVTWNFAGGKITVSDTTAATSATTGSLVSAGGLGIGGNAFFGGIVTSTANSAGAYPASQAGTAWAIGGNFSNANAETNFWNTKDNAGGFDFRQKTGASAATLLATLTTAGLRIPTGLNLGVGGTPLGATNALTLVSTGAQIVLGQDLTNYYTIGRNSGTGFMNFLGTQAGFIGFTFGGAVQVGGSGLVLASGELGVTKIAASGSAPGANGGKVALVCGTNAGSAKLIAYAGTSTTPTTILDNIGSGVSGC